MKFCDNTILLGIPCVSVSLHTSIDNADDPKIDVQFDILLLRANTLTSVTLTGNGGSLHRLQL